MSELFYLKGYWNNFDVFLYVFQPDKSIATVKNTYSIEELLKKGDFYLKIVILALWAKTWQNSQNNVI